jgi:hypothetical protein
MMDCIEVTYKDGCIEIANESDPDRKEDWDEVRGALDNTERAQDMVGWGRWTGLYTGLDEFGRRRYYAVDEAGQSDIEEGKMKITEVRLGREQILGAMRQDFQRDDFNEAVVPATIYCTDEEVFFLLDEGTGEPLIWTLKHGFSDYTVSEDTRTAIHDYLGTA